MKKERNFLTEFHVAKNITIQMNVAYGLVMIVIAERRAMVEYILFLVIASCMSSAMILWIVDILTGAVIPPIGYLYVVIAFFCRGLMIFSKEMFDKAMKGND